MLKLRVSCSQPHLINSGCIDQQETRVTCFSVFGLEVGKTHFTVVNITIHYHLTESDSVPHVHDAVP